MATSRLVHSIGTSVPLYAAIRRSMARRTCCREVKSGARSARRLRILNQHSIWLSQLACAGVKWKRTFLCRANRARIASRWRRLVQPGQDASFGIRVVARHRPWPGRVLQSDQPRLGEPRATCSLWPAAGVGIVQSPTRLARRRQPESAALVPPNVSPFCRRAPPRSSVDRSSGVRLSAAGRLLKSNQAWLGFTAIRS